MTEKKSKKKMMEAIMKQMSVKTGSQQPSSNLEENTHSKDYKASSDKRISSSYNTSGELFCSNELRKIKEFLSSSSSKFEIEASIGTFKKEHFQPGLKSLSQFNNLRRHLDRMTVSQGGTLYLRTYSDRTDKIQNNPIRRIVDRTSSLEEESFTYQKKNRFSNQIVNSTKWGVRVSKSYEEFVDKNEFDEERWIEIEKLIENPLDNDNKNLEDIAVQRIRDRRSYTESNSKSRFYGMKFDLTTVNEIHIKENGKTYNTIKYEVEIERTRDSVSLDGFINTILYVIQHYEGAIDKKQIMDRKEIRIAVSLHNNMFSEYISSKKWRNFDPYKIFGDYWNKPKNIKLKYMLEKDFDPAVTIKLNGKRYSLLFSESGTYMFNPPYDVIKIGPPNEKLFGTLLDCEYLLVYDHSLQKNVMSNIYGFDILFFKGKDVRKFDFDKRLDMLKNIPSDAEKFYGVEYHTKIFFRNDNFYDRTHSAFEKIKENKIYKKYDLVDGLILQPKNWYKNNHTYKWKDAKDLTIDFEFVPMEIPQIEDIISSEAKDYYGRVFWLKVGTKSGNEAFHGTESHYYKGWVTIDSEIFDGQNLAYKIVECFWDSHLNNFIPRLIREDRDKPNRQNTVIDIWKDIMDPIPKSTIVGDTLQLMRKYHNSKKLEMLSKEFSDGKIIIDIGSGRGGDLQKWDKNNMKKVYSIEPNSENLKELQRRQKEIGIKTDVKIMNHGAEKTSIISKELKKNGDLYRLDGIVSFFSLTYFPKEKKLYNDLLKTINLLPHGGKFVGMVLDGKNVSRLLEESRNTENIAEDEGSEYITNAYTISQVTEFDDNIIGNEIEIDITDPTSMVKNQTEWLFYFEPFRKSLEDMGFSLISSGFLDTGTKYDLLPPSSKVFSKLNRSFVFQRGEDSPSEPAVIKVDSVNDLSTLHKEELFYIGVIRDPSNFIHATLRAMSSDYHNMNNNQRSKYAAKTRKSIAGNLTIKMFEELHSGEISKCLSEPYLESYSQKDAMNIAYSEFKLELLDTEKWTGENFLLELTSLVLGVDIYVLIKNKKDEIVPSKKFKSVCKKLYVNDKSIVLVTFDDKYYYVVAHKHLGKLDHIYDSSSEFIKSIHKEVCR